MVLASHQKDTCFSSSAWNCWKYLFVFPFPWLTPEFYLWESRMFWDHFDDTELYSYHSSVKFIAEIKSWQMCCIWKGKWFSSWCKLLLSRNDLKMKIAWNLSNQNHSNDMFWIFILKFEMVFLWWLSSVASYPSQHMDTLYLGPNKSECQVSTWI